MSGAPNFILIGAMKCATTTLHEHLARQPGIFMAEPKETSFFSDDPIYAQGVDWYRALFTDRAANTLCGESSTHYTKLPTYPHTAQRMRELLDDVKLIYMMRHPVDRLISHYVHDWSLRVIDDPIDQAIDHHSVLIDYGRYAMQLQPFIEAYGRERILPVFFERFVSNTEAELARVCQFIGYDRPVDMGSDVGAVNVSRERLRESGWRDAIVHNPLLRSLRRTLVPKSIRKWAQGLWQMKKRPELSAASQQRVSQVFDEDLATLGRMLGAELNCDNFTDVVRSNNLLWTETHSASA
ncbi:MAG: sulfotransferase [Planctomycetaceae bacterium]|nr:sulfotransferase [Planctomycetaceae bacterium]